MLRAVGLLGLRWLVAALLLVGVSPSAANALVADPDYWKSSQTTRDVVYRYVYTKSPLPIPPGYDPVAEAERVTSQAARSAPPSNPATPKIAGQTRSVTRAVNLIPKARTLGYIGLAVGTFDLGWKIGTGLNTKFLRIGLPPPPDPKTDPANGELLFREAGQPVSPYSDRVMPEDGWLLQYWYGGQAATIVNIEFGWDHPIAALTVPPPGFQALIGRSPIPWGAVEPLVVSYWLPEDALEAHFVEEYTDQLFDVDTPQPPSPLQASVEAAIEAQLDDQKNADLRAFLNYQLGSPAATDPLGLGPDNPGIAFPNRHWKFGDHWEEFRDNLGNPKYDPFSDDRNEQEYWRDAAEIVERGRDQIGGVDRCERDDGTEVFWSISEESIVFVRDGEIETYFVPDDGRSYYEAQCSR